MQPKEEANDWAKIDIDAKVLDTLFDHAKCYPEQVGFDGEGREGRGELEGLVTWPSMYSSRHA